MIKRSNDIDKHVGGRVRRRRRALGMSQTRLGDTLGISFQQVQKYENGANRISARRLDEIARVLGVSAPFFFEGLSEVNGGNGQVSSRLVSNLGAMEDGLALANAFNRIRNIRLRRLIVLLTEHIAGPGVSRPADFTVQ